MKKKTIDNRRISKTDLQRMKLKGKPKCPYCQKPLTFIYDDIEKGHLSQKCGNCGKSSVVDTATMEVFVFDDAVGAT